MNNSYEYGQAKKVIERINNYDSQFSGITSQYLSTLPPEIKELLDE